MVGRRGHSREDPIHTQQHIPVHLALPEASVTLQEVFKYRYHSSPSSFSHLSLNPFSPHLSASSPPLPSPHWGPLGRGLGLCCAKSRRSLTLADFPPLTTVERHVAHSTRDAIFSREQTHETPVYPESWGKMRLNLV